MGCYRSCTAAQLVGQLSNLMSTKAFPRQNVRLPGTVYKLLVFNLGSLGQRPPIWRIYYKPTYSLKLVILVLINKWIQGSRLEPCSERLEGWLSSVCNSVSAVGFYRCSIIGKVSTQWEVGISHPCCDIVLSIYRLTQQVEQDTNISTAASMWLGFHCIRLTSG